MIELSIGKLTILLAFLAAVVAVTTPKLRLAAFLFAFLLAFNYWWLGLIDPVKAGPYKFLACAIAEWAILLALFKVKHDGAKWLCMTSIALCLVHIFACLSYKTHTLNWFYDHWETIVPVVELFQVAGIVVFSNPVYSRLLARDRKKDQFTWQARLIQG